MSSKAEVYRKELEIKDPLVQHLADIAGDPGIHTAADKRIVSYNLDLKGVATICRRKFLRKIAADSPARALPSTADSAPQQVLESHSRPTLRRSTRLQQLEGGR